ncbi:antitoxin Xre/MbcA/ParS toxin-binding domain-containing protein [Massilia sp. METH4]|uniref:type II RES/Xre toxin-antitoxin system antitoxin n=1 Tax=Massilia sp. METH4 TaxID=3123041 RepID=UPI0030D12901
MAFSRYALQQEQFVKDATALVAEAEALLAAPEVHERRGEYLAALKTAQEAVSRLEVIANPVPPGERANEFARLLERLAGSDFGAAEAIRAGFPAAIIKDAAAYFDVPAARIRAIVRLPETTAHTLAKRGSCLDAALSERIWRLADVLAMAREVFEEERAARAWLLAPNRAFGGAAPIDHLDTEPGATAVRQVLNAIATGGAA